MRLQGKVGMVIGAGQTQGETLGNGRATALAMAKEGAHLLLVDVSRESAEETQRMIEADGGTAVVVPGDVSSESDCETMVSACLDRYGRIDLLQFNVGIGVGDNVITRLEEASWDRILDVNLKGCFLITKHVAPLMQKQRGGSIVYISSLAAQVYTPLVAYRSSKAGLNALAQSVAVSLAEFGVRANVVMPGLINTPMAVEGFARATGRDRQDIARERDARVPLRAKMGTAWDIAWASVFLHSDEANFITGVVLPVDGGQGARGG